MLDRDRKDVELLPTLTFDVCRTDSMSAGCSAFLECGENVVPTLTAGNISSVTRELHIECITGVTMF